MPIYEYVCKNCGAQVEQLQGILDAPLQECSSCGKPALVKLISRSSFQLKGTGWYVTDFKNTPGAAGTGGSTNTQSGAGSGKTEGN